MAIKLELPEHVVQQLLENWKEEKAALEAHLGELHQLIKSAEAQLTGRFPQGSFKQESVIKPGEVISDMDATHKANLNRAVALVEAGKGKSHLLAHVTNILDREGQILGTQTVWNKTPSGRRPKGENLRIVKGYIKLTGEGGVTATQIARATNIGLSSVRLVLERNQTTFTRGEDGLWKLRTAN